VSTRPECSYIAGHRDGFDPDCWWCWDLTGQQPSRLTSAVRTSKPAGAPAWLVGLSNWALDYMYGVPVPIVEEDGRLHYVRPADPKRRSCNAR